MLGRILNEVVQIRKTLQTIQNSLEQKNKIDGRELSKKLKEIGVKGRWEM